MNINIDSLVTFLIMWGTPTIMMLIAYLKMSKEDKNDVKKDFSSARFIFTFGFLATGYFLASLGNLLTLNVLRLLGIPLMIIAGIIIAMNIWKKNKVRSVSIPLLILFLIVIIMR
ncbi:hypothetical protein [Bacillus massiliglaciei]|uniref:hypothetical protein n=1 Tax=Bacillus massiliglaciei TaxID=1816693 RepID=UPI000DA60B19|nr:hypothetical protein [Bacillus massiliglaciei]